MVAISTQRSAVADQAALHERLVQIVATAESVHAALSDVGALLLQVGGAVGVEWWSDQDSGLPRGPELSMGETEGDHASIALDPVGTMLVFGDSASDLVSAIDILRPVLRLRWIDEQLAAHAGRLARQTEALDDFAGLVAHDVRATLITALRDDDPQGGLTRALGLVDSILEAVRTDPAASGGARVAECVEQAISDLGDVGAEIVARAAGEFPIPPDALRLIMRNLIANAVAAGAKQIHVSSLARGDQRMLVVDDDGVGIASADDYAKGAQLGLRMCTRVIERCGGVLELRPRAVGGTRALIVTSGAAA